MQKIIAFLLILGIALQSCGSLHRVIDKVNKKTDSTATITRDTSNVSHEKTQTNDFNASGIDITVNYDTVNAPARSVSILGGNKASDYDPVVKQVAGIREAIKDAIGASGLNGRIPASVSIHIDNLSNTSTRTEKRDSAAAHVQAAVHVVSNDQEIHKNITRTGLKWYIWVGGGLILLIILAIMVIRKYYPALWTKIIPSSNKT